MKPESVILKVFPLGKHSTPINEAAVRHHTLIFYADDQLLLISILLKNLSWLCFSFS